MSLKLCVVAVAAVVALLAVSGASASEASKCHNATGTCMKNHFVCANEELVPHSKRCDGVEDCADGTDEYLCQAPSNPKSMSERMAAAEASCIKCTCFKTAITIPSTNTAWFAIAKVAPRDKTMLTDAPAVQNKACNPTNTGSIKLNVYKKQNKGCRGWVCCLRQEACESCNSGKLTTAHCWA